MPELTPASPYSALTRTLSRRLSLVCLLFALLSAVAAFAQVVVSLPAYITATFDESLALSDVSLSAETVSTLSKYVHVFCLVLLIPSLAFSLLPLLGHLLLCLRARRGKPLGPLPFTLLRVYLFIEIALLVLNLLMYFSLASAIGASTLSLISVIIALVSYILLLRTVNYCRAITAYGVGQRTFPFGLVTLALALQIIPLLADLLLTVLQYLNPAYYMLEAYTCGSTPEFVLSVLGTVLTIATYAAYYVLLHVGGKALSACPPDQIAP